MPGILKVVPYITSAAEVEVSERGAFRKPRRTHGSDLVHDFEAVTVHLKAFFIDLWKRSTRPFDCGWYAVVVTDDTPNLLSDSVHAAEVNWAPLSEVTILGTPNLATQVW